MTTMFALMTPVILQVDAFIHPLYVTTTIFAKLVPVCPSWVVNIPLYLVTTIILALLIVVIHISDARALLKTAMITIPARLTNVIRIVEIVPILLSAVMMIMRVRPTLAMIPLDYVKTFL